MPRSADNRFSALVLGVVKSKPFQMNMKVAEAPVPSTVGDSTAESQSKGAS